MIDARLLAFPNPRGPEAIELNQLLSRCTELAAKVNEVERQQRATHTDVAEASNELQQLERRSLGGEKVSDAQRRRTEEALARAQAVEQEPWVERVGAAGFAVQDAERGVRGSSQPSREARTTTASTPSQGRTNSSLHDAAATSQHTSHVGGSLLGLLCVAAISATPRLTWERILPHHSVRSITRFRQGAIAS